MKEIVRFVIKNSQSNQSCVLKYDKITDVAPIIVDLSVGSETDKILEIANDKAFPIITNDMLVKALLEWDCGDEIPIELYGTCVEILVEIRNGEYK